MLLYLAVLITEVGKGFQTPSLIWREALCSLENVDLKFLGEGKSTWEIEKIGLDR